MLKIKVPDNFYKEREYIINTIFKYFWEINYEIMYENRNDICLTLNDKNIFIDDSFFQNAVDSWLSDKSMPTLPLMHWNIDDKKLKKLLLIMICLLFLVKH